MKKPTKETLKLGAFGALVITAMLLYACTPAPTPTPEPTPVPIPDQSAIIADWESGPHSADYDLGKGPNTMCTRCHSPQNWIPGSERSMPTYEFGSR